MNGLDLNALRYISMVAEKGSFSKAAKALYMSQPYLSQSVKAFESSIGVKLFDRSSYPIKPTAAGEYVLRWADHVVKTERMTLERARMLSEEGRTRLTIISSRLRNIVFLPQVIAKLHRLMPECEVVMKTAVSVELRAKIFSERNADVFIDMIPYQLSPNMISRPVCHERMMLAVPTAHELLPDSEDFPTVDIKSFAGHKFISGLSSMKYYDILIEVCSLNGFYPNVVLEVPDIPTACAAVAAGVGVTIVPEAVARSGYMGSKVRYCWIAGYDKDFPVFITYYKEREQDKSLALFIRLMEELQKTSAG